MDSIRSTKVIQLGILLTVLLVTAAVLAPAPVFAERSANARSGRIVQVTLEEHPKISQYTDIDSSARGFGKNACGLVAAAAALDEVHWTKAVDLIAHAAGSNYSPHKGIQPSKYVAALAKVYGSGYVREIKNGTLEQLHDELLNGNRVIVDFKVNVTRQLPSAKPPTYAHFARVLGMDMDRHEIYIENTLRGAPYWTVSFQEFRASWEYPETTASQIPDWKNAEDVTRWAVILDGSLAVDEYSNLMRVRILNFREFVAI